MNNFCPNCGCMQRLPETTEARRKTRVGKKILAAEQKKKRAPRKPSAYNVYMKKELKRLRKQHPRMKQPAIFKKAAKGWKKAKRR